MSYQQFLATKHARVNETGPTIARTDIHPMLHEWQKEIVQWATQTGRAAIWADTGLGKTVMQVEWLRHVTGDGYGLIVAPLAVCHQTVREAAKVGVAAAYVRSADQLDGPPGFTSRTTRWLNSSTLTCSGLLCWMRRRS